MKRNLLSAVLAAALLTAVWTVGASAAENTVIGGLDSSRQIATAVRLDAKIALPSARTSIEQAVLNGQKTATVRFSNITDVPLATMQAIAKEAADKGVTLTALFDTEIDRKVKLRISLNPAHATKDFKVGGAADSVAAVSAQKVMGSFFVNLTSVYALNQQDDFGMNVHIAVKPNLDGISRETLVVSHYSTQENTYAQSKAALSFDENGYIHFDTARAGTLIFTDSPLAKK